MRVKDLRVLITGAASGAGRTIAETLADAASSVSRSATSWIRHVPKRFRHLTIDGGHG
jgi:NAD(P)-dependent dehydrogenase (short-subunit alcohol dehydrogenase family)